MIRNIINLKAIILYFGLILCLIAGMPTLAYGSSSYPVKEESYVLVINSYVDGERWSGNLLNMISKFATPEEYTLRIDHISVMLVDTPFPPSPNRPEWEYPPISPGSYPA